MVYVSMVLYEWLSGGLRFFLFYAYPEGEGYGR